MSNHRMFSVRIANSAKFLQMPVETQLLYFHFVIRADDDGIVEAYPIMRLLGIAPDNFKILVAKNFIEILNEDQVIVITDWLEHNKIRADRKVNSIYIDLLKNRCPEVPIIQPKPRSDVLDNSKRLGGRSTVSISKVKLSKVKLSKVKLSYNDTDKELTEYLYSLVKENYNFLNKKTEKNKIKDYEEMNRLNRVDNWNYEQIKFVINWSQNDNFWKQNIRSVSKLRKQFETLVVRIKSQRNNKGTIKI